MNTLIFFIEQLATGLYFLIGLSILYVWWRWRQARLEYRATYFELERDLSRYRQANALTTLILLIELGLIVVGIQQVIAPYIREEGDTTAITAEQIIQDGVFNTPTPSITDGGQIDASDIQIGEDDPALQILLTPTLTPTPVGTIVPNAPAKVGCDTPDAQLQVPVNGMRVFEPLTVIGSANTSNFAEYRFEIRGADIENFAVYDRHLQPVPEIGTLGQFNPAPYAAGVYEFRLMVFDITNTLRASCLVNIYISEPVPTPTPLGQ